MNRPGHSQRQRLSAMRPSPLRLVAMSTLGIAIAGCSALGPTTQRAMPQTPAHVRRPDLPRNATLTIDQIQPRPTLPQPSTRPIGQAPLAAVELFAQARAALSSNQRFTAVQLLDQALAIDPDSYELNLNMGQAAIGTSVSSRAASSLQRAIAINPDATEAYVYLARIQLSEGKALLAIATLRTAQATSRYLSNADVCLAVDYVLMRALTQGGYDLAARDQVEQLLERISRISAFYRGPSDVMQVVQNPDLLFAELAALSMRLGDYPAALAAIEQAIAESPMNQAYSLTRVKLLLQLNRLQQAREFMPEVISRFGNRVEVMTSLREVFSLDGGEAGAIHELSRAMERRGGDMNIGFALADLLRSTGQQSEGRRVLGGVVEQFRYAPQAVHRLFAYEEAQERTKPAARLIIDASARRPNDLSEFAPLMGRLARLSRSNHLRLRDLQDMHVESWAESARLFWIARLADSWGRNELARSVLEKSVRTGKPYAPAYRSLMNHYWARQDWETPRKLQTAQELLMLASMQGNAALSSELRGMIALNQKKLPEATAAFLEAMRLGDESPELLLSYAIVQLQQGNATEAERMLLRLSEAHPLYEDAYAALIRFYIDRGLIPSAMRTLQRWLAADPRNPAAQLYHATVLLLAQRRDAAEKALLELFDENADNTEVLTALLDLYARTGRLDAFITLLENKRQNRPDIREVADCLVNIYAGQHRINEANRVIDDLRKAAGTDPDLLYYVAHLYLRIEDQAACSAMLEEIIRIDPRHSSAANDFGYFLADTGKDLDRAEALIRIALAEEPDNQAFLDSLGWVMYKRGEFATARDYLEQAIAQTVDPDPIVLDHLGDACYRHGKVDEAVKHWQESRNRIDALGQNARGELARVKLQLSSKLRQHRANQPVQTAPVASTAMAPSTQFSR